MRKLRSTFRLVLLMGTTLHLVLFAFTYFSTGLDTNVNQMFRNGFNMSYAEIQASYDPMMFRTKNRTKVSSDAVVHPSPVKPLQVCSPLNLTKRNNMSLSGWTVDQAEGSAFGPSSPGKSRLEAALAQSKLVNATGLPKNSSLVETKLQQLTVDVGNYTWIPGGHWRPNSCKPKWKVAIVIPFRNRSYHLPILLRYLVPMLKRQQLEFGVFVVHQANALRFNRAMLMNVGFVESSKLAHWDCFIFHDVDHVPLSDLNNYGCDNMPRHLVTGDSNVKYKLPYSDFFGAVTGFLLSDVRKINGFPNVYWGWGGEDDEILKRVRKAKLKVGPRPTGDKRFTGFYQVIQHHHPSAPKLAERFRLLNKFASRMESDGLSNLQYHQPHIEFHPLYVNISVDIFKLKPMERA